MPSKKTAHMGTKAKPLAVLRTADGFAVLVAASEKHLAAAIIPATR